MKKLMALVLSLGLVLLGTAPVMAAGQTFALSPSTKPAAAVLPVNDIEKIDTGKMKGVEIPEPADVGTLNDDELRNVEGNQLATEIGGALIGAGVGVATQVAENYIEHKPLMKDTGKAAVVGAITGAGTVTKEVIVVSKYASGLIEASRKLVIDTAKTAVSAARSFAANVAVNWFSHRDRSGSGMGRGGGGGW